MTRQQTANKYVKTSAIFKNIADQTSQIFRESVLRQCGFSVAVNCEISLDVWNSTASLKPININFIPFSPHWQTAAVVFSLFFLHRYMTIAAYPVLNAGVSLLAHQWQVYERR